MQILFERGVKVPVSRELAELLSEGGRFHINWRDGEGADKALLPYFQRDIANGALTEQQAYEIVECLWFKLAELSEVRATCATNVW